MMYYKDIGEGKPVVLLHGFLENGKMWDDFAQKLSKNYRVVIPDLYGHGQTESIDEVHTMELQARGVVEVLEMLEISSAAFIGHSMGGYISMTIARDFPNMVEKLCLFFSNSLPDTEEKKEQRMKAINTATVDQEDFVRLGVKNLFDQNNLDNLRDEIEQARALGHEMPLDGITAALRGMRLREDTTHVLEQVEYPVQVILGEFDSAVDADKFQDALPSRDNIQVDVLPVGHMGHLEAPKESLEIIQDFLKK